jgi:hypothetical protein
MDSLRAKLDTFPRLETRFRRPALFSFRTPVEVVLHGNDLDTLRTASTAGLAALEAVPGLTDLRSSLSRGYPEVRVRYDRARLDALAEQMLRAVPGCALASDQGYRALDLAVDFCEDVPPLPPSAIDEIVRVFAEAGATCKVSSIHVNGWFGAFDKLTGARRFVADRYGEALDPSRWAFFGDSANDEPLFGAFPLSIGVANVTAFLPRMKAWPTWITPSPGGDGFVEGMEKLLGLHQGRPGAR